MEEVLLERWSRVSSVQRWKLILYLQRILPGGRRQIMKRNGLRNKPWGTPEVTMEA